jgi:uncharacterized protein YukE
MLKTSKSVSLSGQSVINGTIAASMAGNIDSESKKSNVNWSVMDQAAYDANKKEVRQDVSDFNDAMYDIEDQMNTDTPTTEPTDDGTNGVTPDDTTKTE